MSLAIPDPKIATAATPRYLSGPISDFMMLGGSTLLLFPLLVIFRGESAESAMVVFAFVISNIVNYPHFAVSYRIFYEDYGRKTSSDDQADTTLRYRYLFAGVVAPIVLAALLIGALVGGSSQALAYCYNLMVFFVGWHYVKQGYGMAMVDAALKRRFLNTLEKKALLVNAYAVWIFSWTSGNRGGETLEFVGLEVRRFNLPDIVIWVTGTVFVVSTLVTVVVLGRRALAKTPTAWIGVVAYLVSLYIWMLLVRLNPLLFVLVPALHSLQYLWVVRKFQNNRHESNAMKATWWGQYWRSVVMGILMFLVIPTTIDVFVKVDTVAFGTAPVSFMFLIFINVHHYFLDNVMWRRGNPEVSQHLFA